MKVWNIASHLPARQRRKLRVAYRAEPVILQCALLRQPSGLYTSKEREGSLT